MIKILSKKLKQVVPILTLIFLVVSTITLSACGTTNETSTEESGDTATTSASFRTLDEIKADGTIKVGVYKDDNTQQSFDEAVAEKLAESLGVKAETVPLSVNDRISALEKGDVDLVVANLTITDERKEKVDFCNHYTSAFPSILTPNDKPLTSEEQINEATIGVIKDTTGAMLMKSMFSNTKLIEYNSYDEFYKALKDGKIDGICTDGAILSRWADQNEGYYKSVLFNGLSYSRNVAPAVAKGNITLKEAVDIAVERMIETNEFAAINETVSMCYIYTIDEMPNFANESEINSDNAKPKDGTYQSDDGHMTMTLKGGTAIYYNKLKGLTQEEYRKYAFKLMEKAKTA